MESVRGLTRAVGEVGALADVSSAGVVGGVAVADAVADMLVGAVANARSV